MGECISDGGEATFEKLGKALGGFEDGVEVVVLEQFGAAVFGDFGMDGAATEFVLDGFEAGFCLVERGGHCAPAELTVLAIFETGK